MSDNLSELLPRLALRAGVFHTGPLCGVRHFARDPLNGHVHLVQRGPVSLTGLPGGDMRVDEPTLVFMPRPDAHSLVAGEGAELLCADIVFGAGGAHPVTDSLPDVVRVRLSDWPGGMAMVALIGEEAFVHQPGRQAVLDRLCEILLVRLLRHCMAQGHVRGGALAGLADTRLSQALVAMHAQPAQAWTLEALAQLASMSRARFAEHFRTVVGRPPADYLAAWRVALGQGLLRAGRPLKHVALEVGYGSSSAFHRAFVREVGQGPSAWLKALPPG